MGCKMFWVKVEDNARMPQSPLTFTHRRVEGGEAGEDDMMISLVLFRLHGHFA